MLLLCVKARVGRVFLLGHPLTLGPQFLPLEILLVSSGEAVLNGPLAGVLSKPTPVTDLVQGNLIAIAFGSSVSSVSPAHWNLIC